jgi:hypothetical protein
MLAAQTRMSTNMTRRTLPGLALVAALTVSGCAYRPQSVVYPALLSQTDALFRVDNVRPGQLEYAPDRTTFAPILTEPFAYPTQAQAQTAYLRALAHLSDAGMTDPVVIEAPRAAQVTAIGEASRPPASIRLFGCKPGALDSQTARVTRYRDAIVHCATDFVDGAGRPLSRGTLNFYFYRNAWHMQATNPPRAPVAWWVRERSPKDPWRWVPGRDRYE